MRLKNIYTSILISCFVLATSVHCIAADQQEDQVYAQFLPTNSPQYVEKACQVYKKMQNALKTEILHDDGQMLPNQVYIDYGWDFPPIFKVQSELLSFCSQQTTKKRFMDIGPGNGYDTVAMLLTQKAHVTSYEILNAQFKKLENTVKTLVYEASPTFNMDQNARFRNNDFLQVKFNASFEGGYTGINLNKVGHFWDNKQWEIFRDNAAFLLEKNVGRLFITLVTPTPGDHFDRFMQQYHSGLVCFQRTDLLNDSWTGIIGDPVSITTRKPKSNEKPGHMFQTIKEVGKKAFVVTDRVMNYHTVETVTAALGDKFRILKVINLSPRDIHPDAFESMISIVAERTD